VQHGKEKGNEKTNTVQRKGIICSGGTDEEKQRDKIYGQRRNSLDTKWKTQKLCQKKNTVTEDCGKEMLKAQEWSTLKVKKSEEEEEY
jgi:hypothetical protein